MQWKPGDRVLLSTPTGSGKTTFIFRTLLPFAFGKGKKIVYLCNRKILKAQIEETVQNELLSLKDSFLSGYEISPEMRESVVVLTYQYCEVTGRFTTLTVPHSLLGLDGDELITIHANDVIFYVFDEAHYFLTDSTFNSNANFWFGIEPKEQSINIFLTATPEPLLFFWAAQKGLNFLYEMTKMLEQIKSRIELRTKLSKPIKTITVELGRKNGKYIGTLKTITEKREKKRAIDEEVSKIRPYDECILSIKKLISEVPYLSYNYGADTFDKRKINVRYYCEFDSILEYVRKATPNNKWLIFIDDIKKAGIYAGKLQENGISTTILSAKTIISGNGARTLKDIAHYHRFTSTVIIATSVLDCGVSIEDSTVKNVVIEHHNKTTFLQMIGRKRLLANESINLYIKFYNSHEINGLYHSYEQRINFLIRFALLNQHEWVRWKLPSHSDDGMRPRQYLSDRDKEKIVEELKKPENISLLYTVKKYRRNNDNPNELLREYEYGKSSFLGLLYDFSVYLDALDQLRRTHDPLFYLKEQLSWIGETYDEENWIGYPSIRKRLNDYLAENVNEKLLGDEKEVFSRKCLGFFDEMPQPLQPDIMRVKRKRFEEKGPQKETLNKALAAVDSPYMVTSKQVGSRDNRKVAWIVKERQKETT